MTLLNRRGFVKTILTTAAGTTSYGVLSHGLPREETDQREAASSVNLENGGQHLTFPRWHSPDIPELLAYWKRVEAFDPFANPYRCRAILPASDLLDQTSGECRSLRRSGGSQKFGRNTVAV